MNWQVLTNETLYLMFDIFYFQAMYFVTIFPYIMMTVLVVRGCTLEGALDGIVAYIKPDFTAMKDAAVSV